MTFPHTQLNKILCTDLDGTFIGDDSSMYKLLELIANKGIILVFSTGRHLLSLSTFIDEKQIRKPDICILMVGTEIYVLSNGEFILDGNWKRIISQDWDKAKIVNMLAGINELTLQDEQWQTEFKASYFLTNSANEVLRDIDSLMQEAGLKAQVIYSADQFLDFLPYLSGKAEALKYIASNSGIKKENVIVCGDSGNDLDMFRAGFKGIIVGNAHTELREYKGENAYHAAGEYSAGIIEGLRYFDFI